MPEEMAVQEELQSRFAFLVGAIRVARARRIFVEVPAANLPEVFEHVVRGMGFSMLSALTGLDLGAKLGVIYHLANSSGVVVNLSTSVDKEFAKVRSVTAYFPAADAYERELVDLLGFEVEGLAAGRRYPLPEDWPANQFPLRKDWNVSMLEKAGDKHA